VGVDGLCGGLTRLPPASQISADEFPAVLRGGAACREGTSTRRNASHRGVRAARGGPGRAMVVRAVSSSIPRPYRPPGGRRRRREVGHGDAEQVRDLSQRRDREVLTAVLDPPRRTSRRERTLPGSGCSVFVRQRSIGAFFRLAIAVVTGLAGCSSTGSLGQPCTPTSGPELGSFACDDGLVCITKAGGDMCGPCSPTDRNASCSLLERCDNGTCQACPDGGMNCAPGAYGQSCNADGSCLPPLICIGSICGSSSDTKDAGSME
jgi:hypothetical protein